MRATERAPAPELTLHLWGRMCPATGTEDQLISKHLPSLTLLVRSISSQRWEVREEAGLIRALIGSESQGESEFSKAIWPHH